MGKGWRDDWDAMARKTVYRQLIGKWGLMSIDYRTADAHTIALPKPSLLASLTPTMPPRVQCLLTILTLKPGKSQKWTSPLPMSKEREQGTNESWILCGPADR